jgi:hypothetical protein
MRPGLISRLNFIGSPVNDDVDEVGQTTIAVEMLASLLVEYFLEAVDGVIVASVGFEAVDRVLDRDGGIHGLWHVYNSLLIDAPILMRSALDLNRWKSHMVEKSPIAHNYRNRPDQVVLGDGSTERQSPQRLSGAVRQQALLFAILVAESDAVAQPELGEEWHQIKRTLDEGVEFIERRDAG